MRRRDWVSYNMSRIRGKDTSVEILFRRALWRAGLRYRLHAADLPGRPDVVFPGVKLAVFCDGGFWHGKDFSRTKSELKHNRDFWIGKIRDNMKRDKRQNMALRELGWSILRLWDDDIKADVEKCVALVKERIEQLRAK